MVRSASYWLTLREYAPQLGATTGGGWGHSSGADVVSRGASSSGSAVRYQHAAGRSRSSRHPGRMDLVPTSFNYDRLYTYRHRGVDQARRQQVWNEIAVYLHRRMGEPQVVLDPAAGRGEFINAIHAAERWVVDYVAYDDARYRGEVEVRIGDVLEVQLPEAHFDAVFASNLLEHFSSQEDIARFLERMRRVVRPGGVIAVLGPNFRYCAKEYFDCADHQIALTHVAVEEHLYAAGFEIESVVPRFLPYSFRSVLPASPTLVRRYLSMPLLWRLLGKQFLVVGRRPS